jgi:hypothetical protein
MEGFDDQKVDELRNASRLIAKVTATSVALLVGTVVEGVIGVATLIALALSSKEES